MSQDTMCSHEFPVVVNPVEGGGWRAHCLSCGLLGPVGTDSVEALDSIQRGEGAPSDPDKVQSRYTYRPRSDPAHRGADYTTDQLHGPDQ